MQYLYNEDVYQDLDEECIAETNSQNTNEILSDSDDNDNDVDENEDSYSEEWQHGFSNRLKNYMVSSCQLFNTSSR